jgi:hypothetical protein
MLALGKQRQRGTAFVFVLFFVLAAAGVASAIYQVSAIRAARAGKSVQSSRSLGRLYTMDATILEAIRREAANGLIENVSLAAEIMSLVPVPEPGEPPMNVAVSAGTDGRLPLPTVATWAVPDTIHIPGASSGMDHDPLREVRAVSADIGIIASETRPNADGLLSAQHFGDAVRYRLSVRAMPASVFTYCSVDPSAFTPVGPGAAPANGRLGVAGSWYPVQDLSLSFPVIAGGGLRYPLNQGSARAVTLPNGRVFVSPDTSPASVHRAVQSALIAPDLSFGQASVAGYLTNKRSLLHSYPGSIEQLLEFLTLDQPRWNVRIRGAGGVQAPVGLDLTSRIVIDGNIVHVDLDGLVYAGPLVIWLDLDDHQVAEVTLRAHGVSGGMTILCQRPIVLGENFGTLVPANTVTAVVSPHVSVKSTSASSAVAGAFVTRGNSPGQALHKLASDPLASLSVMGSLCVWGGDFGNDPYPSAVQLQPVAGFLTGDLSPPCMPVVIDVRLLEMVQVPMQATADGE